MCLNTVNLCIIPKVTEENIVRLFSAILAKNTVLLRKKGKNRGERSEPSVAKRLFFIDLCVSQGV